MFMNAQTSVLYTIGHSTRPFDELIHLLNSYNITLLADVRAVPKSRFYPQYNRKFLEENLPTHYIWLGDRLGGKNAHLVPKEEFDHGIHQLLSLMESETVCIMCSERSPTPTKWRKEGCHRWSVITPVIEKHGVKVIHV